MDTITLPAGKLIPGHRLQYNGEDILVDDAEVEWEGDANVVFITGKSLATGNRWAGLLFITDKIEVLR